VPYPTPPPQKTAAIWALVLSILPLFVTWIAAFALSVYVLLQPRDGRQNGRGLAIAALAIIGGWLVLCILVLILAFTVDANPDSTDASDRDNPSRNVTETQGTVPVLSLKVGDCLPRALGSGLQLTVRVVSCDRPHAEEVYATFDLPKLDDPDQDEVDRLTDDGCLDRFADFVGMEYEDSVLEVVYFRPSAEYFDQGREVSCLVSDEAPSTGSLKNAGR